MKPISGDKYTVRPFKTHKTQINQYTFLSGSNPEQVSVDLARVAPANRWIWYTEDEPQNTSGIFQRSLYASVEHLFYSSYSSWNSGPTIQKGWRPEGDVYVISLAQKAFGEEVRPGSFIVEAPGASTASLIDNGLGQIVPASDTGSIIGNIFYDMGIAVIAQSTSSFSSSLVSHDGVFLTTGSVLEVTFDSTQTIYEHQIMCVIDRGEFNFSLNPSMRATASFDENIKPIDRFASGTIDPYMTTVGLYDNVGQLLAVAKFPRPIKRAAETQQTVIVRFDA